MKNDINQFLYNAEKWSNILKISAGIHIARFWKYVWPFLYIMKERAKLQLPRVL